MNVNYQYRKTRRSYSKLKKSDGASSVCTFCNPDNEPHIIHRTKHAYVLPNRVFYDVWELHNVIDHLLVIPKRHVESLGDLSEDEQLDIMKICSRYEKDGYNVYARAKGSVRRSVIHQHTHLIKIDPHEPRVSFFMRKPWLLIKF